VIIERKFSASSDDNFKTISYTPYTPLTSNFTFSFERISFISAIIPSSDPKSEFNKTKQ